MFIWLFHRISGLVLIVLIGIKIISGYAVTGEIHWTSVDVLHASRVIDILILFLFIFHSLYGLRTILVDLGIKKERLLFWASSTIAVMVSLFSIYFIYFR